MRKIFAAAAAHAAEDQRVVLDGSVDKGGGLLLEGFRHRHGQVADASALTADEVVMGRRVVIKMIDPVPAGNLLYLAQIHQQI